MIKRILLVLMAVLLLAGCSQPAQPHKIPMDNLTLTLPETFTEIPEDERNAAFAYSQGDIFIHGFQELKSDIQEFYDYISLESYARILAESVDQDMGASLTDEIWNYSYTQQLDGVDYTFLYAFFETQESFWQIQVSCPTAQFVENQEILWNYIREVA